MDTNDTNQSETQPEPSQARCAVPICSADPLLNAVLATLKRVEDLRSACAEVGQYTAACQLDDACDAIQKAAGVWNKTITP